MLITYYVPDTMLVAGDLAAKGNKPPPSGDVGIITIINLETGAFKSA